MHIPDGYLSPATFTAMYAASAPFWYVALRKLRNVLTSRTVPLLSILAAFSFTIMMFNIPLPGGTSGHAVGGTLIAVVLGPWAAVVGVSVAVVIQALLFGDGGITSIGANCFNMAIALPLTGYLVYRLVSSGARASSRRKVIAAGVGGYVGINVAAFLTALELGIQPLFFHAADGTPLYAPYPLQVALPVMMVSHLLVAGAAEGVVTAMAVAYLQRLHLPILQGLRSAEATR